MPCSSGPFASTMTSSRMRSSRVGSLLGFAMALVGTTATAEGVAGCGKNATTRLRPEQGFLAKVLLRLRRPDHLHPDPVLVEQDTWCAPGGRGTRGFYRL